MTNIIFQEKNIFYKASEIICQSINKMLKEKEKVIFGTAGGNSIYCVLKFLIKKPIEWEEVHVFMVDERLVPIDHNDSNFRMIKQQLINVIPEQNLHPFIYIDNKTNYGIPKYKNELKKYSDNYDIILLSSGEDGHIGSLFPNHQSIKNQSQFFIYVYNSPKPPPRRMSMSKKMILRSNISFLMVIGEDKKPAYRKYLDKNQDYIKCPSKLIDEINESYIFTDICEEEL